MDRESMINALESRDKPWDIIVIGGGATGLGTAVDAASRGYKTLLLEQYDFAKGTSSRSTKLAHGGVRYLQQGDVSLVFEALKERGLMLQNAPHLVQNQSFIIPTYEWWGGPFYTIGLKVYDMMAGKLGLGPSLHLSRDETIEALPFVNQNGLKGGVIYHDGQFDDARMAISLARTCEDYGGTLINYMKVTGLLYQNGIISGVQATDTESGKEYTINSKVVVNATGVFADSIIKMENPDTKEMIQPSQGIHLVLDQSFLPGKHAIMVPHTKDGRVMFAVPWYNHVVLGTTDTLIEKPAIEPRALEEEIDFVLETASEYLLRKPERKDVLSVFAGLRPLAVPEGEGKATKEISRHHKVLISVAGLLTIIGGKWTTYRKMAEDTVDNAMMLGGLPERECVTDHLLIHGYSRNVEPGNPLSLYGLDRSKVEQIEQEKPEYSGYLSEKLRLRKSQVVWAVRHEMARKVEDVLARRTRALFLDARESISIADETAKIMAMENGEDGRWAKRQSEEFKKLATEYLIN